MKINFEINPDKYMNVGTIEDWLNSTPLILGLKGTQTIEREIQAEYLDEVDDRLEMQSAFFQEGDQNGPDSNCGSPITVPGPLGSSSGHGDVDAAYDGRKAGVRRALYFKLTFGDPGIDLALGRHELERRIKQYLQG